MIRGPALALLGPLLVIAASCALDDGEGFTRLEPGRLRVALEIGAARELGEHRLLTDAGYRVELTRCQLALEDFELQQLDTASGGTSARFDPANPPDGFSLCHGGHCHADDGSLPSYDEVQAELAGGTASWSPIAHVALASEFDLLEPKPKTLTRYEPLAELPEGVIGRAVLRVNELACAGTVESEALPEPLALDVVLPLASAALRVPLDRAISRDGPKTLTPEVSLRIDGTLFDGVDFAALASGGRVELDARDAQALESFVDAAALTVQL
jgi:hypothetical protein